METHRSRLHGGLEVEAPSPTRDLVVVGASAGGVEALTSLVRGLPADVPAAFLVVLHMPARASSRLPEILGRAGPLSADWAVDGERLRHGQIQVAPPDHHVVLSGGRVHLIDGARENGVRPAVDPLFRSAARNLGPAVIGVILSGTMDDGAAGIAAIAAAGGATIVQTPDEAMADGMPRSAIEAAPIDHVVPANAMGSLIDSIAREPILDEDRRQRMDPSLVADPLELPAVGIDLACPDCGGALQQIKTGALARFRCRVGHVYSGDSLLAGKGEELESALWAALRTLEETATVAGRLAARCRTRGALGAATRFEERQADAARRADLVRTAIAGFEQTLNETTEAALAEG